MQEGFNIVMTEELESADGQLSLEKIAQYSGLTLEEVKELADKRTA